MAIRPTVERVRQALARAQGDLAAAGQRLTDAQGPHAREAQLQAQDKAPARGDKDAGG